MVILFVAAAVFLGGVLAVGLLNQPSATDNALPPPERGSGGQVFKGFRPFPAPTLATTTLQGRPFSLAALRGRPVVINFWASYCEGCKQEAGGLSRVSRDLAGTARLVGVDMDTNRGAALAFARAHHMTWPLVGDANFDAATRYGVIGLPTTVFVDARGRVVDKIVGIATAKAIRDRVDVMTHAA
jgi:thiol-disulfide isomerase/thioredoxin